MLLSTLPFSFTPSGAKKKKKAKGFSFADVGDVLSEGIKERRSEDETEKEELEDKEVDVIDEETPASRKPPGAKKKKKKNKKVGK